jgi:alkanesulfonate monooxygenase SsuD/methylene tetrahydromethanopterin reductase-like flavin-dependent oxidoreductase (luciferase family)
MLEHSIVGSPETVRRGLENFVASTNADELMIVSGVYDHLARIRSYEIVAEIAG